MNALKPKLFGTDGIRGAFGTHPLTEGTIRQLGAALAIELQAATPSNKASRSVVVGGDTRDSTATLATWLTSELAARGFEPIYLGTVPTPCIADRVRQLGALCGVAISASHNPHPDNGIKLIDQHGYKWTSERELALEEHLASLDANGTFTPASPHPLKERPEVVGAWLDSLCQTLPPNTSLSGLKVALDAGHGAASPYAEALFRRLGAEVEQVNASPDGRNINEGCGSTHPEVIAALTQRVGADLGFAFDGDADRVILADETGQVRDGDAILYLWAKELDARSQLPSHRIVATTMSNLGLEVALRREGIEIVRCDVGDRHVVATMQAENIALGGEQSGHIVNQFLTTAGDGLLTALHLAALRQQRGKPLSTLLSGFERFPQTLINVPVRQKPDFDSLPRLQQTRQQVEESLGNTGRLVLRYSGTEPLARVMIEGPDQGTIHRLADDLAQVIAQEIG